MNGNLWVSQGPSNNSFFELTTSGSIAAQHPVGFDSDRLAYISQNSIWIISATDGVSHEFKSDGTTTTRTITLPNSRVIQSTISVREMNAIAFTATDGTVWLAYLDFITPFLARLGAYQAPNTVASIYHRPATDDLCIAGYSAVGPVDSISLVTGSTNWSLSVYGPGGCAWGNGKLIITTSEIGNEIKIYDNP